MHNNAATNRYQRVTNAECQKLCRETPGCFYYNFNETQQGCWLKYGIGDTKEVISDVLKFGHKNSPSIVDCEYHWGGWSNCSVSCIGGERTRVMVVTKDPENVEENYRGKACPTNFPNETEPCNEYLCPVDCVSEWGEWSGCSEACGVGTRNRNLSIITQDDYGGTKCPVNRIEREGCKEITAELCPIGEERKNCSDDRCPVDCVFTWSEWSNCSESCGGGIRTRELNITTEAAHWGEQCPGDDQETCNEHPCPVVCFLIIGLSGALVLCIALTFLAYFYRRLITKKEEKSFATLEEIPLKTRQEDGTCSNNYNDEMNDYI